MTFRGLIDANVFAYTAGRAHPLKAPSAAVLELAERSPSLFTNAEVFQELFHRYQSLKVWHAVAERFGRWLLLMAGRIEPMYAEDVSVAADLVGRYPRLSARDLVHVAIARRVGASHIITADRAFDGVEGLARLEPAEIAEWRGLFGG